MSGRTILSVLFSVVLPAMGAVAAVIVVPVQQATIQGAIEAAEDGDIVVVMPGVYAENIDFEGKSITVAAPGGPALTVIDGGGEGPCATFTSGEDLNSILANFTLTGGYGGDNGFGGAVRVSRSLPLILFNVITGNSAGGGGGAVGVTLLGAPTLYRNLIYGNQSQGPGGGVYISGAAAMLVNNTIVDNTSQAEGGAVYATLSVGTQVLNSIVAGNHSGRGGALFATILTLVSARYNDVWNNEGGDYGGVQAGDGSISEDPLFVGPDEHLYSLGEGSPCIDAGDPDLPGDIDGTPADIGCYPFLQAADLLPLSVAPGELDFGDVAVGDDSTASLWLQNPNQTAVAGMLYVRLDAPFRVSDTLVLVDPEGELELSVTFSPEEQQGDTDTLTIFSFALMDLLDTLQLPYPAGITSVALSGMGVAEAVSRQGEQAVEVGLMRCFPNPFNGRLQVAVNPAVSGAVSLTVWSLDGRKVADLLRGSLAPGGEDVSWGASGLASGSYIVTLRHPDGVFVQRVSYFR